MNKKPELTPDQKKYLENTIKQNNIYGDDWIYDLDNTDYYFLDPGSSERRTILQPKPSDRSEYNYDDSITHFDGAQFNFPHWQEEDIGEGQYLRNKGVPGEYYDNSMNVSIDGIQKRRNMDASVLKTILKKFGNIFFETGLEDIDIHSPSSDKNVGGYPKGNDEVYVENKKDINFSELNISPTFEETGTNRIITDYMETNKWAGMAKYAINGSPTDDFLKFFILNTALKVKERSRRYKPVVRHIDNNKSIVFFSVGDYIVRVFGDLNAPSLLESANIKISCTCPFWRWQGPEHWGRKYNYLLGRTKGRATYPQIRDAIGRHVCCKHAYAVLMLLKRQLKK